MTAAPNRKRLIIGLVAALTAIIAIVVFYNTMLFHPDKKVNRIEVELDGVRSTADKMQMAEILKDFNNSFKFSDGGSEPWTCGIDEEKFAVFLYCDDELLYKFAPVIDGCASFECFYNAFGRDNFFIGCEQAKKTVTLMTGNPYLISQRSV